MVFINYFVGNVGVIIIKLFKRNKRVFFFYLIVLSFLNVSCEELKK